VRTANDINPTSRDTRMGTAVMHASEGNWDEALNIWRTLVADDPRFADAEYLRKRYYRWMTQFADLTQQIVDRLEPSAA
jgi:hypothetical protein